MMRFLTILLFILLLSNSAFSQTRIQDILINADEIERDLSSNSVNLVGNVKIVFGQQIITCGNAHIDLTKKEINGQGYATIDDLDTHIEGEAIQYNYETKKGVIFNGVIHSGQVVFEGDVIEKTGEKTYWAQNGKYTACSTCPPGWSFSGSEINAELGGYADIKYPIMRIAGFPVFFLPRILVPLKSERQSGLLVPSIDYSRDKGTAISLSYFWAMNRSQDLTYTATNYQLRGIKNFFDYRYVLSPESKGNVKSAFIADKNFVGIDGSPARNANRWYLKYSHDLSLPGDFKQKSEINLLSDLRYLRDFPEEFGGQGNPALENSFALTKNYSQQHLSVRSDYFINLLKTDPLSNNDDAVHKFPEIKFSHNASQIGDTDVFFAFDSTYTYFTRNGPSHDDVKTLAEWNTDATSVCAGLSGSQLSSCQASVASIKATPDGEFDPNQDIIRTGQRLDLNPQIYIPIQAGKFLNILPSLSYKQTLYSFDPLSNDPTYKRQVTRKFLKAQVSMKTQMSAIYQGNPQDDVKYKHKIEPEIIFGQVPWVELPDHPFFGSFKDVTFDQQTVQLSETDFGGQGVNGTKKVQFDYEDRIFDRKTATWGIVNRLTRKTEYTNSSSYKNIVVWSIYQTYDFREANSEGRTFPWSSIYGTLILDFDSFQASSSYQHYVYARRMASNSSLSVPFLNGSFASFSYAQNFSLENEEKVNTETISELIGFGLGVDTRFIKLKGTLNYNNRSYKVVPWDIDLMITPPGNCWNIMVKVTKAVNSEPSVKFNLSYNFGSGSFTQID